MSEEFDALFKRYRRDAVLLHRPYPPHLAPRTNSYLGGLPRLPAHHEWPRTSGGTPLHFLAQIDCAELPFSSPLPDRGVLFFFGRDDAEQVWGDGNPADDCRVLYLLDAFAATPWRPTPDDLPPIGDEYGSYGSRDFLRPGEQGSSVHAGWPVRLVSIDSWPDEVPSNENTRSGWLTTLRRRLGLTRPSETYQFSEFTWQIDERQGRYSEELDQRRAAAFAAASGEQRDDGKQTGRDGNAARSVFFHDADGRDIYPQYWAMIHYAARALLRRPASAMPFRHPRLIAPVIDAAEAWLARANAAGHEQPVPFADRTEFRDCLTQLTRPKYKDPLPYQARDLILASLVAVVRSWAGSPDRAALIPSHIYDAVRFRLNGFAYGEPRYAQMLGHAPSAQEPLPLDDPTVCLLNLGSDIGMGWMFGDVGNATFWIKPDDLARRDFTRAWATIEGH